MTSRDAVGLSAGAWLGHVLSADPECDRGFLTNELGRRFPNLTPVEVDQIVFADQASSERIEEPFSRHKWLYGLTADRRLNADALRLAIALHKFGSDEQGGRAWPTQQSLAQFIGGSDTSKVRAAVRMLQRCGWLVTEKIAQLDEGVKDVIRRNGRGVTYRPVMAKTVPVDKPAVPPQLIEGKQKRRVAIGQQRSDIDRNDRSIADRSDRSISDRLTHHINTMEPPGAVAPNSPHSRDDMIREICREDRSHSGLDVSESLHRKAELLHRHCPRDRLRSALTALEHGELSDAEFTRLIS